MKRFRLKIFVLVAVLATAVTAWAYYTTVGEGTIERVRTRARSRDPVLEAPETSSGSHTLSWSAATLTGNPPSATEITYKVQRKVGSDPFGPASGDCTGSLSHSTLSCNDTVGATETYTYRVIATFRSWTATSNEVDVNVTIGGGDTQAPTVQSINRFSPAGESTNASSVTWRVTFSESVTGVDSSDFALAPTVTGAGSVSVSPVNGSTYDVSASTGSGNGALGLDLVEVDHSIKDAAAMSSAATRSAMGTSPTARPTRSTRRRRSSCRLRCATTM